MQKEALAAKKWSQTVTLPDIVHKNMTMRPTECRNKWKLVNYVGQGTPRDSALHMPRCGGCGNTIHFKTVCRSMQRQQVDWRPPRNCRSIMISGKMMSPS